MEWHICRTPLWLQEMPDTFDDFPLILRGRLARVRERLLLEYLNSDLLAARGIPHKPEAPGKVRRMAAKDLAG
jgi:hypothetical protein